MKNNILVIDVESLGLHGPAFAVGYILVDLSGNVITEGTFATNPNSMGVNDAPALQWAADHIKIDVYDCLNTYQMRKAFWNIWDAVRHDSWMAADCNWPVESNFLSACIADDPVARMWHGPYPLLDISTMRIAGGYRCYKHEDRLENELPEHNPLNDARQSARLLTETLPNFNGALDILERGL